VTFQVDVTFNFPSDIGIHPDNRVALLRVALLAHGFDHFEITDYGEQ
jgi:hypothetical protein